MTPSTTTSPRRHRSRRFSPWILAALAGAAAALWAAGRLPMALQAAPLPGTASLTGAVDASAPFRAAQVSIRNVDNNVLYMVYTNGGQFRAVNLFPGRYEVSAATKGFVSETLKLDLKPGPNAKVKLTLQSPTGQSQRTIINSLESETTANSSV